MGDVVDSGIISRLPVPPEKILRRASAAGLTQVVIVGFDADGNEYFASSEADAGNVLYHLHRAHWALMLQIDAIIAGD